MGKWWKRSIIKKEVAEYMNKQSIEKCQHGWAGRVSCLPGLLEFYNMDKGEFPKKPLTRLHANGYKKPLTLPQARGK